MGASLRGFESHPVRMKVIQVKQKALGANATKGEMVRPVILVTLPSGHQAQGHELEILGPSKLIYRSEGKRHTVKLETDADIRLTNWEKDIVYEL